MTTEETAKATQNAAIEVAELAVKTEDEMSIALASTAEGLTIKTGEELGASTDLLKTVMGRQKALADTRMSITRPMDAAKKRVMELFKPAVDRLAIAERNIKGAVLGYTQEQERQRREAQAELDAAAERERLHLLKQAETHEQAGKDGRAETLRDRAETVQAPTVAPASVPRGAVHVRTTWHAEVTDLAALAKACGEGRVPLELIQPDMTILNAQARTFKGALAIPGVKAVSEEGVAARS